MAKATVTASTGWRWRVTSQWTAPLSDVGHEQRRQELDPVAVIIEELTAGGGDHHVGPVPDCPELDALGLEPGDDRGSAADGELAVLRVPREQADHVEHVNRTLRLRLLRRLFADSDAVGMRPADMGAERLQQIAAAVLLDLEVRRLQQSRGCSGRAARRPPRPRAASRASRTSAGPQPAARDLSCAFSKTMGCDQRGTSRGSPPGRTRANGRDNRGAHERSPTAS